MSTADACSIVVGSPRVRLVSRLSYFVLFWSNLGVMREKPVAHAAQR